jgi:hypothetical protein
MTFPQRLFVCSALLVAPLFGQSQAIDGNIDGFVRSEDGSLIERAQVRASNTGTGFTRETFTDDRGYYNVQLLPPGAYTVTVSKTGFSTTTRTGITLAAGQIATVDVRLKVGEVTTTVEVNEQIPSVEVARTTAYANTYGAREARSLPVAGRSLLDFFVVNPIVNAPPLSTGGSGTGTPSVSFGGLGFRQINVDGVSNNIQGGARNLVISQEAIGEVQTVTNYSAEFGRQAALLLNAFSQSGTNDLHGSAYLFTRNRVLSARPYLLAPTAPTPDFFRYNYGATLGGPIKRDRAFYFLSYERWSQDLPVISTFGGAQQADIIRQIGISPADVGSFTTTFRAHTVTAKGNWQLNSKNFLSARYNYYRDRESPLQGGLQTREVSTRFDENPQSGTVQLVTTLSPNLLNEARFLYIQRDIENGATNPQSPQVTIQGIGSFNGNQDGTFSSLERGVQFIDNFTWNLSRHSLKFGFDILPASFRERTRNLNGLFTFSGLPAATARPAVTPLMQYLNTQGGITDPATGRPFTYTQFTRAQGAEFFESTVVNQGYFIQDEWRVTPRLKLNLGLRYELFLRPSGNLNPDYPATGVIPQDYNNLAPRLAASYDPVGDGRTVIRAGYGIYYNTTVAQTFNTFLRGNGVAVRNVLVTPDQAGAPAFTRGPVPPLTGGNVLVSNLNVFASEFRDPMVHNYFVTFERELFRDHSLAISYFGNRARSLPYALLSNLERIGTLPDGRAQFNGTRNRPDPRFGNIITTGSDGFQNYNGMLITFTRRFSQGLSFQGGYQYQDLNGVSFVNSAGAFTSFGAFTSPSDVTNPSFDQGFGDFSQPHRFTLTAVWDPRLNAGGRVLQAMVNGWSISTRTVAQSGLPFSPQVGQDLNGDTVFNDRPAGFAYNSERLPSYATIDIRASRSFTIGELGRVEVIGEVFNAAKRLNVTGVNQTFGPNPAPNANFKTPTAAETTRQFQLAIRYSF